MIGEVHIEQIFAAELAEIQDPELRSQVVRAWVEACRRGGKTSPDELEAMPFTLLVDCRGVSFVAHCKAVVWGAIGLAEAQRRAYGEVPYPIDRDRLVAAALLHDLGKLVEIERAPDGTWRRSRHGTLLRHPLAGAVIAGRLGVDEALLNTVACHSKEGEGRPLTPETVLVKQADFATFDPLKLLADGRLVTA